MTPTQTTLAAIGTLALFTYLYKENPIFRFAEHCMIGLAAAHSLVMTWDNYWKPTLTKDIPGGEWYLIIPLLLGLLIYTRYFGKISWYAKIPMSLWVGYGVGYTLAYNPRPFLTQVSATFLKLNTFDNVLFLLCAICVLAYFLFTVSHEKAKPVKYMSWFGRFAIMVALGASFGNTVQGRLSLLIGRIRFLLEDWLKIISLG